MFLAGIKDWEMCDNSLRTERKREPENSSSNTELLSEEETTTVYLSRVQ